MAVKGNRERRAAYGRPRASVRAVRPGKRALRPLLLLGLLWLCACTGSGAAQPEKTPAQPGPCAATLLVYMAGSDLETKAGAASADLEEMRAALPADGSLRVAVLASGAGNWHSAVAGDAANIYELTPSGLELRRAGGLTSMGAPETLEELLRFGYENFPAERYALLLWDHGAGPMLGVCFDELFPDDRGMDSLSLEELGEALAGSPFAERKLEWIGFDACLMACLETARTAAPYARYMIASQELEPAGGWDYAFLREMPLDDSGADTGRRAVEGYRASCLGSLADVTLSCLDLGAVAALETEMTALFGSFEVTPESYPRYAAVRAGVSAVGYAAPYDYDLVDLGELLRGYETAGLADCSALFGQLAEATVCAFSSREGRCGLSLYYPFRNKERYLSPWGSLSTRLGGSEGYRAFLDASVSFWLGEALVNWDRPHPAGLREEGDRIRLTLQLEPEEAENLASARLVVVDEDVLGQFFRTYLSEETHLTSQGLLWCDYAGEALYYTDGNGAPRSSSLFYELQEDCLLIPANVYNLSERGEEGRLTSGWSPDGTKMPFFLVYRQTDEGSWRLMYLLETDETGESYGKSSLRLEDWDILQTASRGRILPERTEGRAPAFFQWELGHSAYGYEERTAELGPLMFLRTQDNSPRYAFFELTDLQGNSFSTEPVPLPNPYRSVLSTETETLLDCPSCTVTLEETTLIAAEEPVLQLILRAENFTDAAMLLQVDGVGFGSTLLPECGFSYWLEPGAARRLACDISVRDLQYAGVPLLEELTLAVRCRENEGDFPEREALGEAKVSIPLHLELRGLGGSSERRSLSRGNWNSLIVELLSLEPDPGKAGEWKGLLRFLNDGAEILRFGWHSLRVNGERSPGFVGKDCDELELLPGEEAFLRLSMHPEEGEGPGEIRSIAFTLYACIGDGAQSVRSEDEAELCLTLDPPVSGLE